ncbi:aldose epimerase family protein [Roseibacillus ishigakijimensis]|uniref:Aldose 1-epimerase n=1 Tax=Roseibacillus ishigakijimensis TaxID=454146 RepID=A0A934RLG7_9BACT|nr:aldose epimerase family protein [Roseibacillus ishigakijimensis]MBK1833917.1 galactose mutarotase [Roseibacillus ishigakijimensis]
MTAKPYGTLSNGREATLFTLTNKNGMEAKVTDYGAILVGVLVPDKDGTSKDVTLGFDDLAGWEQDTCYLGATVGRFGNRIAHGKFSLDGKDYQMVLNNEPNGVPCHLHGGTVGFNSVLWESREIENGVEFTYLSADGEEGYPGEVTAKVRYLLTDDNELIWQAEATTTAATPLNMVHHSYWNLSGDSSQRIESQRLQLEADHYLPTDPGLIPTGEVAPVAGTPLDFRQATVIGEHIEDDFEALKFAGGYDHAWVVNGEGLRLVATLSDPASGRSMTLHSEQPAVHFYAGSFLESAVPGKNGQPLLPRTGLCLETELYPDGPNKPAFPNCILRPGETYRHTMVHKFSW